LLWSLFSHSSCEIFVFCFYQSFVCWTWHWCPFTFGVKAMERAHSCHTVPCTCHPHHQTAAAHSPATLDNVLKSVSNLLSVMIWF
jgi:hypothetical protein